MEFAGFPLPLLNRQNESPHQCDAAEKPDLKLVHHECHLAQK